MSSNTENKILTQKSCKSVLLDYKLDYAMTEWGKFYLTYKEQTQQALSKRILKMENEIKKRCKEEHNPYRKTSYIHKIFDNTYWDEEEMEFVLPPVLRKEKKSANHSYETKTKQQGIITKVYDEYKERMLRELDEVKQTFEARKSELEIKQNSHHKEHANTQVACPFCGKNMARTNLARHAKNACPKRTNDEVHP
jgi:hypothetical protein